MMNYEGLFYDIFGMFDESVAGEKVQHISIGGAPVQTILNKEHEFPYDWDIGAVIYIVFLSAVFMGTIILEGVDTSLMAKASPAKLNDTFLNSGLLATLVGTLGRVLGDSMITLSALLDIHVFVDFVNATFLPLLLLALGGYYLVKRHYKKLI
jgi:hypothetical protein